MMGRRALLLYIPDSQRGTAVRFSTASTPKVVQYALIYCDDDTEE